MLLAQNQLDSILKRHMPIKILYIHHDGQMAGSAISLRNLLLSLDRDAFQPRVLLGKEGPARKFYEELEIPVDVLPMRFYATWPGSPWFKLGYYTNWLALYPNPQLSSYLQARKPDIVHINDKSMLAAGLVASRLGFPIVWHLRSSYNITHSKVQAWASKKIIRSKATHLIAISEDEADGFEDLSNLSVIYNTVDFKAVEKARLLQEETRNSLGIKPDEVLVGMVGRLSKIRGAWDFIEIAGLLKKEMPGVPLRFIILAPIPARTHRALGLWERLGLVDTTHPEDKAWQLARQFGISEDLLITGYRSDPLAVIAAMDIFVSCNHYGVAMRPPFEAMAVGTPVAAWEGHSGKSRILINEKTALVVPRWSKLDLVYAILRLIKDDALRNKMSLQGQKYSRLNFDSRKNTKKIEAIYYNIMKR